jgi:Zn-dependent protease
MSDDYQDQMTSLAQTGALPTIPAKKRRGGAIGSLLAAAALVASKLKFLLVILKFGFIKTLLTLLLSMGSYALVFGSWSFAAGLVGMILIHEMGHVFEIRRQGMKATAPIFIPFMGAAIFQRSHPTTAYKQGLIGIAGPILGTVGATVAAVGYLNTHWSVLLIAAWIGFYINLFNLIPMGMLDGGWILGAVSKWAYVAGMAILAGLVIFMNFVSPILLIIVVLSLPMMIDRFRHADSPYYANVTSRQRWGLFGGWLSLVLFLGWASLWAETLLSHLAK